MPRRMISSELLKLLRAGGDGVVSGEQLSRELGVSRTAIWKQISALRVAGYRIEAVPSQGYCLLAEPDLLDQQAIRAGLASGCLLGRRLVCCSETASTNSDAFRLAEEGAEEGTVVLADRQLAGKGRLGRRWESPAGVNLYCSVVLRPELPPYEAPQLTFLSAVAVARAIHTSTGLQPVIKWPNDLLLNGRKVAGLLNEMNAETDRVGFVILGIGVNLNMREDQFPPDLRSPATSLLLETGSAVVRQAFAVNLLRELEREYLRFKQNGFGPVREDWTRYCNAFGREVRVEMGPHTLQGPFAGIDHDGALLMTLPDGRIERILSGDVTVI
ncbi:biotin--[acetyl-CoA-carboxylase] ligase [Trichlorobacter lovleyi]|uniref:biotin--[acetyl-CoA-carboxylase] ligase n=1 Tax=Trichlorobacter lovleyi TaxID=313985 RepID=UPI0023F48E1B|nr:biotin--[acetyl-CoA-carboxylase] ligase [Trichlorobacter lovleyi]